MKLINQTELPDGEFDTILSMEREDIFDSFYLIQHTETKKYYITGEYEDHFVGGYDTMQEAFISCISILKTRLSEYRNLTDKIHQMIDKL